MISLKITSAIRVNESKRIEIFVSDVAKVNYSVPQGSVLGLILILLYVNDFFILQQIFIYADNTVIFT